MCVSSFSSVQDDLFLVFYWLRVWEPIPIIQYDEYRFEIHNKMSKNIGILCKLRSVLPEKHLFMLYNSLILPYINYCNIVWTGTGSTKLDAIYKLQKKALRICTCSSYLASSCPLFYKLNTLNVFDIRKLQIALLMFKCLNNIAPKIISSWFIRNNTVHNYNTRSSNKLHFGEVRNDNSLRLVRHQGPRIWNNLSEYLVSCTNFRLFKNKLKSTYVSAYNN